MANSQEQLKQAVTLIKAGDRSTAIKVITSVLKSDKRNVDAWFLMANALTDRDQQIKALENALKIQPGYSRAQEMLDKLRPPEPEPVVVEDDYYEDDDGFAYGDDEEAADAFFGEDEVFEDDDDPFEEDPFADEDDSFIDDSDPFADDADDELADIDPRLAEAVEAIQVGDSRQAIALAQEVIREDRNDVNAWWVVANALPPSDKKERALEKVIELEPGHTEAREWLAELRGDDDDGFVFDDDDESDPFAGVTPAALDGSQRRASGATTSIPLSFEIVMFLVMLLIGVGGYFALRAAGGEGTLIALSDAELAELGMGMDQAFAFDDDFSAGFGDDFDDDFTVGDCEPAPPDTEIAFETFEVTVAIQGSISRGESITRYSYPNIDEGWVYSSPGDETISVSLVEAGGGIDPYLYIFSPDQVVLYSNDDDDLSLNSRIEDAYLGEPGDYIIVAGTFLSSECGDYTLTVD